MDAAAFLKAIDARLTALAEVMEKKYPTVGLSADDFAQEARMVILHRFAVANGQRPKQNDGPAATSIYDPVRVEPWTFAAPIANGAMIDAALAIIKPKDGERDGEGKYAPAVIIETCDPAALRNLSESKSSHHDTEHDEKPVAERFKAMAERVGARLTDDEAEALAMVHGEDLDCNEAAERLGTTALAVRLRGFKARAKIRDAAGAAGAAAFAD